MLPMGTKLAIVDIVHRAAGEAGRWSPPPRGRYGVAFQLPAAPGRPSTATPNLTVGLAPRCCTSGGCRD